MLIINDIEKIPPLPSPLGLSIGSFDGFHLGHQTIIKYLRTSIGKTGTLGVLTFSNHPAHILAGRAPLSLLTTLKHKLLLLERAGVDLLLLLPFTQTFAEKSYGIFLDELRKHFPFSFLLLGENEAFGKNREGDVEHVTAYAKEHHFTVEYLQKISQNRETVSSGLIRSYLAKGDIQRVSGLLGRPYSIYGTLHHGQMSLQGLCAPPEGIYSVQIHTRPLTAHITKDLLSLDTDYSGPTEIIWH